MKLKILIKLYSRRIISVFLWLLMSICSLRGWNYLATSLKPGENQIWLSHDGAKLLTGSWVLFAAVVVSLSVLYIYELKYYKPERLSQLLFWITIIGLSAIFVYPFGSHDHFAYVAYAHLHAHYGLNPYQDTVSSINNYLSDPFLKNMWWVKVGSVYGPIWTWMSYALYRVFSSLGLIPLAFGFKMLGLLSHILITVVVYRISESVATGRGIQSALLYGMNPLAIFELVANAHNDGPAIILLLVSLSLIIKKHYFNGFVIAGMSVACKLTAGLAIYFMVWKTAKERGLLWAICYTIASVILVVVLYLCFLVGSGEGLLRGLENPLSGFVSNSLVAIPLALGYDQLIKPVRIIGLIIFGILYINILINSQKAKNESFFIMIGLAFVAYYLFGAYVVLRWYFLWPLAIMAVVPDCHWTKTIIGQSLLMLFSYTLFLMFGEGEISNVFTYLLAWVPLMFLWILRKTHVNLN